MLDGGAETEEDVHLRLLARALQKVVGGTEVVVLRIGRIEVHEREDVVVVADALGGVDQRPVMRARRGQVHRIEHIDRLLRTRADQRTEPGRVKLAADRPRGLREIDLRHRPRGRDLRREPRAVQLEIPRAFGVGQRAVVDADRVDADVRARVAEQREGS